MGTPNEHELKAALEACMNWLYPAMYDDHIKPKHIDVAKLREVFSEKYIRDVLEIRLALGKE